MPSPLIVIEMPLSTSRQESKRRRESRPSVNLSSYLGKPWQSKSRITPHGSQKTQQLSESSISRWSSPLILKRLQSHGIQSGKTLQVYKGHTGPVTALAFCDKESRSGDNKILITGSWDRVISSQTAFYMVAKIYFQSIKLWDTDVCYITPIARKRKCKPEFYRRNN